MAVEPMIERARRFTAESIRSELQALARGSLPDACPPVDADGARQGARAGSPLALLLDGYRAGHQAQWTAWLDAVESTPALAGRRAELVRHGSEFFFAYAARLSAFVTDEYMAERDQALRSLEQRRMRTVLSVLDGDAAEPAALDYDMDSTHLGVVASGPGAEPRLRSLAARLDARVLMIEADEGVWWGWFDRAEAVGRELPLPLVRESGSGTTTALGIGSPGSGLDGFRRTHRQATAAHRAAARADAVVAYEDVALEDLASRNTDDALAFVIAELHGIDGDDPRSRRLRTTLRKYFAAGQNAKAAAAALEVHQQTVAQRLAIVEERTGRSPIDRRAELELALRLRAHLTPEE